MWYRLVAYRKAKGWRSWVAIGYRKDGVTLYTNGSHMDEFKSKHPELKIRERQRAIQARGRDPD